MLLKSDSWVRNVVMRVIEDLPYGYISGADYFRSNGSKLAFTCDKGFRPEPSAPWAPFHIAVLDTLLLPDPLCATRDRFCMLTAAPEMPLPLASAPVVLSTFRPRYHDLAWEDEIAFEWDVSQVAETTTVEAFTSIAMETAPVGPPPQDRQLMLMLPTARLNLDKGALVGVARAALWWLAGSPVSCTIVSRSKDAAVVERNRVIARMTTLNLRDLARFEVDAADVAGADGGSSSSDPP